MRIDSGDLALKLQSAKASGSMPPLWSVTGEEPLLADESCDAIRAAARALGHTERVSLGLAASSDWNALYDAGLDGSLFDEKKILEVRFLSSGPGAKGAKILPEFLEAMCESRSVAVVFRLPELDWQAKKSAWFKALEANTVMVQCEQVGPARLPVWIQERLRAQNQTIDADALRFFASQTEGNLLAANQEIKKLALLYPEGNLGLSEIEACVLNVSRFSLDAFIEAIASGNPAKTARIVAQMKAQDEALPVIVAILGSLLNEVIALSFSPSGYARSAAKRLARRVSAEKAASALARLSDVDRLSKGLGAPMRNDVWDELANVTLYLAG